MVNQLYQQTPGHHLQVDSSWKFSISLFPVACGAQHQLPDDDDDDGGGGGGGGGGVGHDSDDDELIPTTPAPR